MIPFRKSIGFRLLGISFILLTFPLLVDSFILIQKRYEHTILDAKEYLAEITYLKELPFNQIQPLNQPLLDMISYFLNLQSDFPIQPDPVVNEKLKLIADIGNLPAVFLLEIREDDRYIVTASSLPDLVGKDYEHFFHTNNFFSSAALDKNFSSFICYNRETLAPYLVLTHLIYSFKEGDPVGILVVSEDITDKLDNLFERENFSYEVNFALLLPTTVVLASSDPNMRFHYFLPLQPGYRRLLIEEDPHAAQLLPDQPIVIDHKMGYPFFEFDWNGVKQVGYIKQLSEANFSLLTYVAKSEIFHSPITDFLNTYSMYILIFLIGGLMTYLITMRMAKPIQKLSLVMQKIQEGDLKLRYEKDPLGFEINILGDIFNKMIDAVIDQKKVAEKERVKKETYAHELWLGQQAQLSLLPQKMPSYYGVDIAVKYIPAIEVGGDFYDVFLKPGEQGDQLILGVADASGKGVQACFYSLSLRHILRTYAQEYDDIGMAMSATNNLIRIDTEESGMFITVLMGVYNHTTGIFHYFSAGHNPAILRKERGEVEELHHQGVAMGVVPTQDQHAASIKLEKGDSIIFYTDGITEAHNEHDELYGEKRLMHLIKNEGWRGSTDLVECVVKDIENFSGKTPQHDDITLLIMKII
ncbi:MAG: PP2C family protein-serine/threonine phosphatase [Chlamydiales bacterium]